MGKMTISKDPSRQVFAHVGNDCWECKDYKTIYMTIRPTKLETDVRQGRDPSHYILCASTGESFDGIIGLPQAFTKGYTYADEIYESRFG
tara:strand:- start:64 stop:333 length:270 start_codon:yes stop_codon:yes gene_type:complete